MTAPGEHETRAKLAQMRRWLEQSGAGALRLRGVDWFAWATAGGSNAVLLAAEAGVAEVLVTAAAAYLLTDPIEAARLQHEEVLAPWTWQVSPWAQRELREHFVQHAAAGAVVLSDRPGPREHALPACAREARLVLGPQERERYRRLGRLAAGAAGEALRAARPRWSEHELAGAAAHALCARGLQPALVLAAGEERLARYRHPLPTARPLGRRAMLVLCARRHGLYANLTRFVCFGVGADPRQEQLMALEAVALDACEAGQPLCTVYRALDGAYAYAGWPDAILQHHQGGITGYLAREVLATAHTEITLREGMALAFNPSLDGIKIEDTFLLEDEALCNLTFDPDWPWAEVQGRRRPLCLERA
ncbi:M24 family metallopeptidase [Janthinobacterium fluminis]|uniref:M24 family metallopeptidase n=1 Tax=Janthinobacterium fluminis TaxID=2987524 RepID=A0ABT5JXI8_9BURK|nr:M24 family metallopeptidase [Janthinobacterium fluminis]MDC8757354.1 M24 family metallopeptidase [Janthinobacterium fluminis]